MTTRAPIIPTLHKGSPGRRGSNKERTARAEGVTLPATSGNRGPTVGEPAAAASLDPVADAFGPTGPFMVTK